MCRVYREFVHLNQDRVLSESSRLGARSRIIKSRLREVYNPRARAQPFAVTLSGSAAPVSIPWYTDRPGEDESSGEDKVVTCGTGNSESPLVNHPMVTRSRGPAVPLPYVQEHTLEYKRRSNIFAPSREE